MLYVCVSDQEGGYRPIASSFKSASWLMLLHVTAGLLERKELAVTCSVTIVIARQILNDTL